MTLLVALAAYALGAIHLEVTILCDTTRQADTTTPNHPPTPSGPLTRARARAMQQKVNSLLSTLDLGTYLDGMLFTSDTLCVIRYVPQEPPDESPPRPEEEEEEREQPRHEEEKLHAERYYRLGHSGTTAHHQPTPGGTATAPASSQLRQSGTTAAHQERYYRSSGTTAHQQAVLPLAPEAPHEDPQKSSGKST